MGRGELGGPLAISQPEPFDTQLLHTRNRESISASQSVGVGRFRAKYRHSENRDRQVLQAAGKPPWKPGTGPAPASWDIFFTKTSQAAWVDQSCF